MMVALTVVALSMVAIGIAGAFIGYTKGHDDGFEAAIDCFEEEVKNAYVQSETE